VSVLEIRHLYALIVCKILEIIEMVLRYVGQDGNVRLYISEFFKIYRVRADLGNHDVNAPRSHFEKQFVKFEGIGRRQTLPDFFAENIVPFRADKPGFYTGKRQNRIDIMRGGSLAVRADDRHEFHAFKRSQKAVFAHLRIRFSRVFYKHEFCVFRLFFGECDKGAIYLADMIVSVVVYAFETDEQIALFDFSRIYFYFFYLRIQVHVRLLDFYAVKQVFKFHKLRPPRIDTLIIMSVENFINPTAILDKNGKSFRFSGEQKHCVSLVHFYACKRILPLDRIPFAVDFAV
jgi:hypothetical protein